MVVSNRPESFGWETQELFTEDEFLGHDILEVPPDSADDSFCYLDQRDRFSAASTSSSSQIEWKSCLISDEDENITFLLDSSRKKAWSMLKDEVEHFRRVIPAMISSDHHHATRINTNDDDTTSARHDFHAPSMKNLLMLAFGKETEFSSTFCRELDINHATYLKFMAMICLQMAYRETPMSLYDETSLLKDKVSLNDILF